MPTPEQIRQDDTIGWQQVEAYAGGKVHSFDVKALGPVRWKGSGAETCAHCDSPIGVSTDRKSKLLYRDPAYFCAPTFHCHWKPFCKPTCGDGRSR